MKLGIIYSFCYNLIMSKPRTPENLIEQIKELRQKGNSIPEMHAILGISKSTIFRYCEGVEILSEFRGRWLERRNASKIISDKAWNAAHNSAKELINSISEKELKIIGAALYWAEGAKRQLNFINSDPEMIKLFLHSLIRAYKVPLSSIKISLRLFEDISVSDAIKFWSVVTNMELSEKNEINIINGSKKGKLPYGMCRIRVKKGGLLLKTMFAINKRVVSIVSPRSSMD